VTLTAQVPRRLARATVKIRKSASRLTTDELEALRVALAAMMARRDDRGYQFYARWHGVPDDLCAHGTDFFLPWHRGYLYHFELALQEHDRDVTLPWWDWMDEPGIPDPYLKQRAGRRRNVLYDAPIEPGVPRRPGWPARTSRQPPPDTGPRPLWPPLRPQNRYDWLMAAPSFTELSRRIEFLHNNIHGLTGGTMASIGWAAYDPLFWAHHTMVDRLWRIWQHNNKGALPAQDLLDVAMTYPKAPSLTVRQVLETRPLGYEYAATSAAVPGSR
jgi:tyrosinase